MSAVVHLVGGLAGAVVEEAKSTLAAGSLQEDLCETVRLEPSKALG